MHCNFGFCLQVKIRKNVIMQMSKGRWCCSNSVVELFINGSVVGDDTIQVTEWLLIPQGCITSCNNTWGINMEEWRLHGESFCMPTVSSILL